MSQPALQLIEESLQSYSDVTINVLAQEDASLNDMSERANRGNMAAGMAAQLRTALTSEV